MNEEALEVETCQSSPKQQRPDAKASFYERLRELRDADRIFVKSAPKPIIRYIDQNCQFEVLDNRGVPIYFALDTTDAWASTVFEGSKPFNVMILDFDYSEVLKITGPGLNRLHGSAIVKHSGKEIGRIVQDDHLCSFTPLYGLEGINGVLGAKVKGPENSYATGFPTEGPVVFDVVLPSSYSSDEQDISLLGKISRQWLLFGKKEDVTSPEETYVVDFHQNMDLRTKCLLLSLVFMLDYQFYHKHVEGGVSRKVWIWFSLLFLSLVILILIACEAIKDHQANANAALAAAAAANASENSTSNILDADDYYFDSSASVK